MTITRDTTLIEAAHELQGLIDEQAPLADQQGELTEPVVEALHDAGIFGMWTPRELGGSELWPRASLQVLEQLSWADPSVCWVVMAASLATGTGGAYLADEAVAQLFAGDRVPVIAGQGTRPERANQADGGHVVNGRWNFASGIKHAGYIHTAALIEETGQVRIFVLPVEQATLIDNWDVLGLRATGSIDYTIEDVLVPEAYSHDVFTKEPVHGGDLYRMGIMNLAGICHSGWALGLGRRMLDELAANTRAKAGRPGQTAGSDAFQANYGRAEAKLRAARALVFETWADVEETLARGESPSKRQETLIRLSLNHATWSVHEVVMFAYTSGGTTALRAGKMQQLFRDMHAGTQHITSAPTVLAAAGRELAGTHPDADWVALDLVDPA
jgi:alkylation response protein AidB-like acyl-CoA dehydrogenase